jgi:hypothetical protein
MPESPSSASSAPQYDAFLSYSRADRDAVRRIQRFLESYRPPNRRSGLKVYLDETDMRGGSLPDNLSTALSQSSALVVCWSDKAAQSQWVNMEIAEFRRLGAVNRIAVAHVAGAGPTVKHDAFAGLQPVEHDLRNGLRGWFLGSTAKIELLRLIAFLTDIELRRLHNWARARTVRNGAIGLAAAVVPVAAVLALPQRSWDPLPQLSLYGQSIQPAVCNIVDGRLWAAAWYQAIDEQSGATAYFVAYPDAIGEPARKQERQRMFPLANRALSTSRADPAIVKAVDRRLAESGLSGELPQGARDQRRYAEPRPGHFIFLHPILLTETERNAEIRNSMISRMPPAETKGTFIVTYKEGATPALVKRDDISPPRWQKFVKDDENEDPTVNPERSPSREISVAWQDNDEIWIGIAGERGIPGGLWHSADAGAHWEKIDGFYNITSLYLVGRGSDQTLMVAEQGFAHLQDTERVRESTRLVERASDGTWNRVDGPPYGSDSEIEICGALPDGTLIVRVNGTIYRESSRSLFRSAVEDLG